MIYEKLQKIGLNQKLVGNGSFLAKWDSIYKKGLTWPEPKTSRSEIVASWQTDQQVKKVVGQKWRLFGKRVSSSKKVLIGLNQKLVGQEFQPFGKRVGRSKKGLNRV